MHWIFGNWHHAFYVVWAAYAVVLTVWIVLQKKEPAATLAWVFSLAFLPVLGFLVFYFSGPRRVSGNRTRRLASYGAIREAFASDCGTEIADSDYDLAVELTRMVQHATGMPLSTCRSVRLLVDG